MDNKWIKKIFLERWEQSLYLKIMLTIFGLSFLVNTLKIVLFYNRLDAVSLILQLFLVFLYAIGIVSMLFALLRKSK